MWNAIRGAIGIVAAVMMVVFTYLGYVNTIHEQARRKAATVEVSTTEGEPATATITVSAKRAPPPQAAIAAPSDEPSSPTEPPAPRARVAPRQGVRPVSTSKLFSHPWHLPLANRDVWLQQVAGTDAGTATFVVRDVTGPVQEPIGFGTAHGNAVRIALRVMKETAPGEFVKRDATLRLTLSDDGNELTGDFRGEADVERGPVLWLAAAVTTPAVPPPSGN